ncbi:CoA pyrophosphatase [Amylibacter sp. SFDW26]|uniref:CoA pyrophosphatase n=1 Tax=Amylibacter sp. SFDW26 TaxID=2652722 RepID=UPI001D00AE17|nr:CoA pyrophosphatase [Amylibacter sp. SFDW26]
MRHESAMESFRPQLNRIEAALSGVSNIAPSSDFDLNHDYGKAGANTLTDAAVLIPITKGPRGLEVIFTKRSQKMRNHPGQISFPGGKADASDTSTEYTALRETHEEIGLHPDSIQIIGALPKHETVTAFLVHPYVGLVPEDAMPKALTGEVSEVFSAPLDHLLNPANYQIEGRMWQGQARRYFSVPYGPYYIWGATARMMRMFTEIMETHDEG